MLEKCPTPVQNDVTDSSPHTGAGGNLVKSKLATALFLAAPLISIQAEAGTPGLSRSSYKMMEQTENIETWSWQTRIRNAGMGDLDCIVIASFLDREGFLVTEDREYVILRGNQTVQIRGQTITGTPSGIVNAEIVPACRQGEVSGGR